MTRFDVEVTIDSIGARGDGVGTVEGARIFVPYTMVGDRVVARLGPKRDETYTGRLLRLIAPGPGRREPPCRHFGACGGCALQHLDEAHYQSWKRALVMDAMARRSLDVDTVEALRPSLPALRRRADLTAIRQADGIRLGLNERGTHRVIDIGTCPVLRPSIVATLASLRATLSLLFRAGERAEVVINAVEAGLDILLVTTASFGQGGRKRLTELAETLDLARLSRRHPEESRAETLVERRPVVARFAGVPVALPPGAFLQATEEGERHLVDIVREGVGRAKCVADLFAGAGTFTFPIADGTGGAAVAVHAVDGTGALIGALDAAAKTAKRRTITTAMRDLERMPLAPDALNAYDAVVFDPPRAGAKAQAEALARSRVPTVVAVSCEPQSFARDARILVDGGFRIMRVVPVDQFLWSPRVEVVAVFKR